MAQVGVEEAAALEVRLRDTLRRGVARDPEQLVVREPVDAAIRVLDELRVARRAVGRLGRELDVQPVEAAAPTRRPLDALLLPLDDAAGDQAVQDLARRHPRRARDLQQRVHVEDAVDAREQIRLLGSQREVLVARHRVRREDGDAVAVAEALAEDLPLREAPDALHDDGGRRQGEGHVGVEDPGRSLEPILARVPRERREDDLLDQAAHLGVEHGARDETALDEELAEARPPLLGDRLERPGQVGVADGAAALQERPDALSLARGRRRAQLALLEEEVTGLVAVDERQRPLQALEEDSPQDLRKGRLGQGSPEAGGRRLCRHAGAVWRRIRVTPLGGTYRTGTTAGRFRGVEKNDGARARPREASSGLE